MPEPLDKNCERLKAELERAAAQGKYKLVAEVLVMMADTCEKTAIQYLVLHEQQQQQNAKSQERQYRN